MYLSCVCACVRELIMQHQTKCTALTYPNSSALNTEKEKISLTSTLLLHCISISVFLLLEHLLAYFYPSFLSLYSLCNMLLLFPPLPFSIRLSLISCSRMSIKGIEEVCHLTFLPTDPFIFFKQEESAKVLTVGFRRLLSLTLSSASTFAIRKVS